jgi:uncharacterized peroxidase-related enzyme
MPRLHVVEPNEATGDVKEIFGAFAQKIGKVINIFKGMGNSAAALKAYTGLSGALAAGELAPEDREAIYLSLSEKNDCGYCVAAHTMLAQKAGLSADEIIEFRRGGSSDAQRDALIKFVFRVVQTNGFVDDAEIETVQEAGYTDGQIAEAVAMIALVTYTNLFNHVFGSELDFPAAPDLT